MKRSFALVWAFSALTLTLSLLPARAADVSIQDAWARATGPNAKTGAVYLSITSAGGDRLVGVSTPVAAESQIHETYRNGNVMGMRRVDDLPLSASGPTVLAPGGYHIMLLDLKQALTEGRSFPLTLSFAKAGSVMTTVRIEAAGANGPLQDMGPGHDMDNMPGMSHK